MPSGMPPPAPRPPFPRYEIDTAAIRHNFGRLRGLLPDGVAAFCSLKRDAYGFGAETVAEILTAAGADGFAAARLDDAARIRRAAPGKPILLYGGTLADQAGTVEALDLMVTIGAAEDAVSWNARLTAPRPVFLKIDVGLLRFGFTEAGLADFLETTLPACDRLEVVGVYTHLSEKPDAPAAAIAAQKRIFDRAVALCRRHRPALRWVCASSTDTVHTERDLDYGMVDVGVLLFGLSPPAKRAALGLQPALTGIRTRLVAIRPIEPGMPDTVGMPAGIRTLGIAGFGWGDGFPKRVPAGAYALVRGQPAPVVAPPHVEQIRLDLTGIAGAAVGDEVCLLGRQGEAAISMYDLAAQWSLKTEDIVCGLRGHVPRIYL